MPEQWNNFFFMVGSGAAALAGLIFVAMSINHVGVARAARSRGYKVEFREDAGFLAMRQGEEVSDKPKRRAKATAPATADSAGEVKRRGRPPKSRTVEEAQ